MSPIWTGTFNQWQLSSGNSNPLTHAVLFNWQVDGFPSDAMFMYWDIAITTIVALLSKYTFYLMGIFRLKLS